MCGRRSLAAVGRPSCARPARARSARARSARARPTSPRDRARAGLRPAAARRPARRSSRATAPATARASGRSAAGRTAGHDVHGRSGDVVLVPAPERRGGSQDGQDCNARHRRQANRARDPRVNRKGAISRLTSGLAPSRPTRPKVRLAPPRGPAESRARRDNVDRLRRTGQARRGRCPGPCVRWRRRA